MKPTNVMTAKSIIRLAFFFLGSGTRVQQALKELRIFLPPSGKRTGTPARTSAGGNDVGQKMIELRGRFIGFGLRDEENCVTSGRAPGKSHQSS